MSDTIATMSLFNVRCLIRDVNSDRRMRNIRRHYVASGFVRTMYL